MLFVIETNVFDHITNGFVRRIRIYRQSKILLMSAIRAMGQSDIGISSFVQGFTANNRRVTVLSVGRAEHKPRTESTERIREEHGQHPLYQSLTTTPPTTRISR